MANVDYDAFEALGRLAEAERNLDERSALIMTFHAALEREMDYVLAKLLPYAEKVRRIGFAHKIQVLAAAWIGDADAGELLRTTLVRFNDVRNAVAHGDTEEVEATVIRLRSAYAYLEPGLPEAPTLTEITMGICCFMGDGPMPHDILIMSEGMEKLMIRFGEAFGTD